MNEESDIVHAYRTALYIAISLMRLFQYGWSLMSLMVLVLMGLILIVNMI